MSLRGAFFWQGSIAGERWPCDWRLRIRAGSLACCRWGGEFPVGGAPLSRLPEARRVPVFLACGRKSDRYPSAIVCDNLKLLHSAGMDLTLRQYPGGDQISPGMLGDMDRWIMDIVTGASGRNDLRRRRLIAAATRPRSATFGALQRSTERCAFAQSCQQHCASEGSHSHGATSHVR